MVSEIFRVALLPKYGTFDVTLSADAKMKIVGGYERTLLFAILRQMRMNYTLSCPKDGEWGSLDSNGSWTGLVGMIQRNEVDIAIGALGVSEQRSAVIQYSYPYTIKDVPFATRLPVDLPGYYALIMPFDYVVWAVLLFVTVAVSIFAQTVLTKGNMPLKLTNPCEIFGILVEQSMSVSPVRKSQSVVLGTWFLSAMWFSCAYKSLILAFLSVPLKERGVENAEQLSESLKSGSYTCATQKGTLYGSELSRSLDEHSRTIGNYIISNNWLIEKKEMQEYLLRGNTAIIISRQSMRLALQDSVFISKHSFFSNQQAIGIRKNCTFTDKINGIIHEFATSGIYQKDFEDYAFLQKLRSPNRISESKPSKQIKLSDLSGAFIILVLGNFLGFVVFIFEITYRKILNH